jgi:hypothetical protein
MFGTDKCPFCQKTINPTIDGWAEHGECGEEKPKPSEFRGFDGQADAANIERNERGDPVDDIYFAWSGLGK